MKQQRRANGQPLGSTESTVYRTTAFRAALCLLLVGCGSTAPSVDPEPMYVNNDRSRVTVKVKVDTVRSIVRLLFNDHVVVLSPKERDKESSVRSEEMECDYYNTLFWRCIGQTMLSGTINFISTTTTYVGTDSTVKIHSIRSRRSGDQYDSTVYLRVWPMQQAKHF